MKMMKGLRSFVYLTSNNVTIESCLVTVATEVSTLTIRIACNSRRRFMMLKRGAFGGSIINGIYILGESFWCCGYFFLTHEDGKIKTINISFKCVL